MRKMQTVVGGGGGKQDAGERKEVPRSGAYVLRANDEPKPARPLDAENPAGAQSKRKPLRPTRRRSETPSPRRSGTENEGPREERVRRQHMEEGEVPGAGAGGRSELGRSGGREHDGKGDGTRRKDERERSMERRTRMEPQRKGRSRERFERRSKGRSERKEERKDPGRAGVREERGRRGLSRQWQERGRDDEPQVNKRKTERPPEPREPPRWKEGTPREAPPDPRDRSENKEGLWMRQKEESGDAMAHKGDEESRSEGDEEVEIGGRRKKTRLLFERGLKEIFREGKGKLKEVGWGIMDNLRLLETKFGVFAKVLKDYQTKAPGTTSPDLLPISIAGAEGFRGFTDTWEQGWTMLVCQSLRLGQTEQPSIPMS